MKILKYSVFFIIAAVFTASFAFAGADVEKGKALFNDTKLAGGTTGKSCSSCHPGGRGLEDVGEKTEWKMMGKKFKRLEDVVNYDIEMALHGKPLDPKSEEMINIIAYIKSLKKE